MSFADEVKKEAAAQKALRAEGKPIPPELKKYTRKSGMIMAIICTIGCLIIVSIGLMTGSYYIGFILLFAVLAVMGLFQAVTGRSLLVTKK